MKINVIVGFIPSLILCACTNHGGKSQAPSPEELKLTEKGQGIYTSRCAACHGSEPYINQEEAPNIFGSSKEVLTAKVLSGTYPKNHSPKRTTKKMGLFPELKDDIEALSIYLNSDI